MPPDLPPLKAIVAHELSYVGPTLSAPQHHHRAGSYSFHFVQPGPARVGAWVNMTIHRAQWWACARLGHPSQHRGHRATHKPCIHLWQAWAGASLCPACGGDERDRTVVGNGEGAVVVGSHTLTLPSFVSSEWTMCHPWWSDGGQHMDLTVGPTGWSEYRNGQTGKMGSYWEKDIGDLL
jgi:hypothetical protein